MGEYDLEHNFMRIAAIEKLAMTLYRDHYRGYEGAQLWLQMYEGQRNEWRAQANAMMVEHHRFVNDVAKRAA